jgi:tRNA pseudouridine38-40 synthase
MEEIRNIKIILAYDGSKYNGWAKNKDGDNSVQDVLERNLSDITGEKIILIAASRLDKRVHALGQVVNFRTQSKIPLEELKKKLRDRLEHIYILAVENAPLFFHARQHALGKKYVYQIWNATDVERRYLPYCFWIREKIDVEKLKEYATIFIGQKDFKNFSKTTERNTTRTIFDIRVKNVSNLITIEFSGDGFLYNMVRCISAYLLNLALNRLKPDEVLELFNPLRRTHCTPLLPPEGLYLKEVIY